MPKFSIIMQSFLGDYKGAASNREEKLKRAILSVLAQSFSDWELIVVADGCDKSFDIVANYSDSRIDCFLLAKQTMWSGACRNFGISKATGEYIVYLDADDYFGVDHLKKISTGMGENDWVWFDDHVKTKSSTIERTALINQKYQHGTANVCHKRSINANWSITGYGQDDWGLTQSLMRASKNYTKIGTPEYIVCHIPNKIDL